jgi:hypothetical protein
MTVKTEEFFLGVIRVLIFGVVFWFLGPLAFVWVFGSLLHAGGFFR